MDICNNCGLKEVVLQQQVVVVDLELLKAERCLNSWKKERQYSKDGDVWTDYLEEMAT